MILESLTIALLLLINAVGVVLVLFQLPGTWLILSATGLAAWLMRDAGLLGWWTLGILVGLAVVGEVVETASGAVGSRRSGGSKRGAVLAVILAIVGATIGGSVAGSLSLAWIWVAPAWVLTVLLGAAVGAAVGAIAGDKLAGRPWSAAGRAGMGAALGRLGGTVGKVLIATTMWIVVIVAIFV